MCVHDPDLKPHPGVHRRPNSTVWHFFVSVPTHLKHHFDGKTFAHRKSLGTRDLVEANRRAKVIDADWAQRFGELEKQDNPQEVAVTPALVAAVATEVRRWVLLADDNMRSFPEGPNGLLRRELQAQPSAGFSVSSLRLGMVAVTVSEDSNEYDPLAGLTDDQAGAVARFNAEGLANATVDLARRSLKEAHGLATSVCREMGLRVDWTTADGRAALAEIQKVYRTAQADLVRRDAGEVVDTPMPSVHQLQPQGGPAEAANAPLASNQGVRSGRRMSDALAAWKELGVRKPKTVSVFERHVRQFEEMAGNPPLVDIGRAEASKFSVDLQRWAVQSGKTKETADNVLASIKALVNAEVRAGRLASNPFAGLAVLEGGKEAESREPWTPEELPTLFASPIFTAYAVPPGDTALNRKAGLDAAYWVPLLCLYTGARPSEVCQLWTDDLSDVRDSEGQSLLVLEFRKNNERGQSLKNPSSWRALPVHSKLMELGFKDYLQAIVERQGVAGPLFPAIPRSGKNGPGGQFGQWFGEFKKAQGFNATKTLHSFRHTVETELGFAEVSPTIVDAITGHEGQGIGRKRYGATIRRNAVRLRPHVEKLRFEALSLQKVFQVPTWFPIE